MITNYVPLKRIITNLEREKLRLAADESQSDESKLIPLYQIQEEIIELQRAIKKLETIESFAELIDSLKP